MHKSNIYVNDIELQVKKYITNNLTNLKPVVYKVYISEKYLFSYPTTEKGQIDSINKLKKYLENFISEDDLLEKLNIDNELPELLKESIMYCIQNECMNEVVALLLLNYDEFKTRIYQMLLTASKILNKSIDEIIRNTDYEYTDQRANRINNAFSEVRAVIALNDFGCNDIRLLPRADSKCADIVTFKNNIKYVIDVKHYTDSFQEQYNERFSYGGEYSVEEKFKYNITKTYEEKREQLIISQENENAHKKALFIVIDETNAVYALNKADELEELFDEIILSLDFIEECDILLLFKGTLYSSPKSGFIIGPPND